jgi:hypothetical protein
MTGDTLKLLFTYIIATLVVVGGGAMLFFTRLDPSEADVQGLRLLISGFMGGALSYVFTRETATQATRAAQSSFASAQPTVTTTSGPPTRTTITPPEAPE